ncbi:MAG: hypothetical protein JRN39_03645 [Nitrososphaerota archaeon]|nr:hypothetical protein [Nitrososphaerota archaeon]MDG6939477.1 hypothetical protein [Nitrososphaerota archaeon]
MKDYQKQVVWVDYFDSTVSRSDGRRVPAHLATKNPTLAELLEAARRMGLQADGHPARRPSTARQSGYIQVEKRAKKSALVVDLAKELSRTRSQTRQEERRSTKQT